LEVRGRDRGRGQDDRARLGRRLLFRVRGFVTAEAVIGLGDLPQERAQTLQRDSLSEGQEQIPARLLAPSVLDRPPERSWNLPERAAATAQAGEAPASALGQGARTFFFPASEARRPAGLLELRPHGLRSSRRGIAGLVEKRNAKKPARSGRRRILDFQTHGGRKITVLMSPAPMAAIVDTHLSGARLSRRGKVRELYDLGDSLLLVASDRISAFDCVLSPGIPGKGKILTQLSNFWFRKFPDVENHILETDVDRFPEPL